MSYKKQGSIQGFSSNGNKNYLNKKYYRYNNSYYYYYPHQYDPKYYEPQKEEKENDKNNCWKEKNEDIYNEDLVSTSTDENLSQENEKLKNEIKNLKEMNSKLEEDNQKLKISLKEKENKEKNYVSEIKEKERLIQNLNKNKNNIEFQVKEKEKQINTLKIEKEKKLNELKNAQNEKNSYFDELNKQKDLIAKLKEQKLELEKSLENERKKNQNLANTYNLIKEKEVLYKNKFEQIKNIISDIGYTIENKIPDEEKNKVILLNEEKNKEKEAEEEENNNNFKNGNGKVGIFNTELNCYMSSVIQIIKNIKDFSEKIMNFNNIDDDIFLSLKDLIYSLYYSKKNAICISDFKKKFSKVYKRFEGKKSDDSTFFLIYLFTYLQKILPKSKKRVTDISEFSFLNLNNKEKEELKKFLIKFELKNNTIIHDLFYNYQMSELICSGCNETKVSFQSNNVLFLSLYDGNSELKSLEQCINSYLYTKDKKNDKDFTCSKCGRSCLSHVISLVKLPPVLVINLKRVGEEQVVYENDIEIPFTFKTKNLEKLKKFNKEYELIGFIIHLGSAEDGHNIAFTKNIFDQKWYKFNDNKVVSIKNNPPTDKAFLLFYQLID